VLPQTVDLTLRETKDLHRKAAPVGVISSRELGVALYIFWMTALPSLVTREESLTDRNRDIFFGGTSHPNGSNVSRDIYELQYIRCVDVDYTAKSQ